MGVQKQTPCIALKVSFLGLSLLGRFYDEVVPTEWKLTNKLHRVALMYSLLTINSCKYHVSRKSDKGSRTCHPRILSFIIDAKAHGWRDYQVIFNELGVAKGQRTETFLAVFLSCWLCTFIFPFKDAGCIRPGTFRRHVIHDINCRVLPPNDNPYKCLNEISRSLDPGRGGGQFPAHFLYAWLAKNINTYALDARASSSLVMVNNFNSKRPENTLVPRRAFAGIHPSSTDLRRLSWMTDVPADLDFDNLPDPKIMLHCHHMLTRYGTMSQVLLPERCNLLERNTTRAFFEWWSKIFISSTFNPHIVHFGKSLEPFFPTTKYDSSYVKIPRVDVTIPTTPFPVIPIQSITPLP
ncbi:hypothetical protein Cgig2_027504 [Carnegiea gigantea]|uniref:Aminotransferase-like plant mobile domain-containing protein n=1 Tax=Carnegiea gigantea TaxID=171969 RepID=A0A9Q1GRV3_9CARY|nr:hypothetical protein Cgig2_027504 [Carnegiea gigantea]